MPGAYLVISGPQAKLGMGPPHALFSRFFLTGNVVITEDTDVVDLSLYIRYYAQTHRLIAPTHTHFLCLCLETLSNFSGLPNFNLIMFSSRCVLAHH